MINNSISINQNKIIFIVKNGFKLVKLIKWSKYLN